ncbi:hypothetical protein ACLKA6_002324 [Drosophila palustris]
MSISSSFTPVNHLAGVSENPTRANINPFANGSKILRSPPAVPHSAPPAARCDFQIHGAKRKRRDSKGIGSRPVHKARTEVHHRRSSEVLCISKGGID